MILYFALLFQTLLFLLYILVSQPVRSAYETYSTRESYYLFYLFYFVIISLVVTAISLIQCILLLKKSKIPSFFSIYLALEILKTVFAVFNLTIMAIYLLFLPAFVLAYQNTILSQFSRFQRNKHAQRSMEAPFLQLRIIFGLLVGVFYILAFSYIFIRTFIQHFTFMLSPDYDDFQISLTLDNLRFIFDPLYSLSFMLFASVCLLILCPLLVEFKRGAYTAGEHTLY